MKLSDLLTKAGMLKLFTEEKEISGITSRSDRAKKGDLYVCTAENSEIAREYVSEATENGAAFSVTEFEGIGDVCASVAPRELYSRVAAAFYDNPQHKLKTVGITGTNGKTSTAWMIHHILNYCGHKSGLLGTVTNEFSGKSYKVTHTTPSSEELFYLMSEMLAEGCTHCVMEVSSHGLIQQRTAAIRFDVGVFTNLTQDHLDYHGDMDSYAKAKSRLFSQSEIAVVNKDSNYCKVMLRNFSGKTADYSVNSYEATAYSYQINCNIECTSFRIAVRDEDMPIKLSVIGDFNVYNATCALLVAVELGIPLKKAVEALEKFEGVPGRMEVIHREDFCVVRDYAHTPDAVEKLLLALRPLTEGRLVVMLGCGGDRDRTKRPIMGRIAVENSDIAIITSDNPRTEKPVDIIEDIKKGLTGEDIADNIIIPDRRTAIKYGLDIIGKGDILVLAGKGHETYQILSDKVIDFDEKVIVAKILSEKS